LQQRVNTRIPRISGSTKLWKTSGRRFYRYMRYVSYHGSYWIYSYNSRKNIRSNPL